MPYFVRGRVLTGAGLLLLGAGSAGACGTAQGGGLPDTGAGGAGDGPDPQELSCKLTRDCPDGMQCDRDLGQCVGCKKDGDCESDQACVAGLCHTTCHSDNDCTSTGQLCGDDGACVDCVADNDCGLDERCSAVGNCVPENTGTGGTGTGGTKSTGGQPMGGSSGNGGSSGSGGTETGEAGMSNTGEGGSPDPGNCVTAAIDPCVGIPHYTGTQTVDGDDADFCKVAPFTLSMATSPYYRTPKPAIDSSTGFTARVAWSTAALHVFIKVTDISIHPNPSTLLNIWNGDNVEFFASPKTPSGSFNYARTLDGGAFQAIAAPPGGATPNGQAAFTSTGYASAVPAGQFSSKLVAGGYTIEAQIPWTDAVPVAGTTMGFDMGLADDIDGAINANSEYRNYYSLLYNFAMVGGYCTQYYEPYCDSRNWCKPTALE